MFNFFSLYIKKKSLLCSAIELWCVFGQNNLFSGPSHGFCVCHQQVTFSYHFCNGKTAFFRISQKQVLENIFPDIKFFSLEIFDITFGNRWGNQEILKTSCGRWFWNLAFVHQKHKLWTKPLGGPLFGKIWKLRNLITSTVFKITWPS